MGTRFRGDQRIIALRHLLLPAEIGEPRPEPA